MSETNLEVNFERKLTLKGISEGTAFIEVRRDGFIQTQLEVAVLKKKNVRLSFQFVEDGFKHRTKRNQSQIFSLITELNIIYIPQTNIEFSSRLARNVRTGINLGKQVNFPENLYKGKVGKASRREWDAIVKLGDKGADINVFFVHLLATNEYLRNCRKDKNCYASDLMGYHAFKNCMIDDDIEPLEFAGVVAHETGHALTIIGHNPKSYYLMTDHSTLRTLISKVESVKMNLSIK